MITTTAQPRTLALLCAVVVFLAACGGEAQTDDGADTARQDAKESTSIVDRVSSCGQVAGAVEPYIQELVLTEDSTVDEWGVSCTWETAEGETDFANIRSVEVLISDNHPDDAAPDTTLLKKMDGFTAFEDPWLSEQNGVAYSLGATTAVAGVIASTVWLPEYDIAITGGKWGDLPPLDGPAAIKVARQLVG